MNTILWTIIKAYHSYWYYNIETGSVQYSLLSALEVDRKHICEQLGKY